MGSLCEISLNEVYSVCNLVSDYLRNLEDLFDFFNVVWTLFAEMACSLEIITVNKIYFRGYADDITLLYYFFECEIRISASSQTCANVMDQGNRHHVVLLRIKAYYTFSFTLLLFYFTNM